MNKKVFSSFLILLLSVAGIFAAQNVLSSFQLMIFNLCGIYVIFAVSMNLINGFTGQLALGHAGFIAIGAYVYALMVLTPDQKERMFYLDPIVEPLANLNTGFLPAILVAGVIAAFFGFLIGFPVLRLRGDYLAIATLGFGEIIRIFLTNLQSITNGALGLKGVPKPNHIFGVEFSSSFTWWVWLGVIITVLVSLLLINSTYGRALKAIREDEIAAQAMGINLFKHKMLAMVVSSFFAGVGGALYAAYISSLNPASFKTTLTYNILLIVVIGGLGSISGSVISAVGVTAIMEWLRFLDEGFLGMPAIPGLRMVVFAAALVLIILFAPKGLLGNEELSWQKIKNIPNKFRSKSKENKMQGVNS